MMGVKYRKFCFFILSLLLAFGVLTLACTKRSSSPRNKGGEPVGEEVSSSSKGTVEQSEEEKYFDKWVDFVNCYYVHSYLSRRSGSFSSEIDKEIIAELDIDFGCQLCYDSIIHKIDLLTPDSRNSKEKARDLADSINAKKKEYKPGLTKEDKITILLNLPTTRPAKRGNKCFKVYLENETKGLNAILNERFQVEYEEDSPSEIVEENVADEPKVVDTGQAKKTRASKPKPDNSPGDEDENGKKSFWWLFIILGFAGGFAVRGMIARKVEKKRLDDASDDFSQEKSILKEEKRNLQQQIDKITREYNSLKQDKEDLLNENIALGEQLDKMKSESQQNSGNVETNKQETIGQSSNQHTQPTQASVLYADAILEDKLVGVKNVPGDDTIYELRLKSPSVAEFVVFSNATQRIIANPSFIEGCDKQILPNASTIEIVSSGLAKKDESNGKWMVTEKLKLNIK